VATSDIDIAVNLIHLSIFGEVADGDADEAMEEDGAGSARSQAADRSSRPSRAAARGRQAKDEDPSAPPSKKRVQFQSGDDDQDFRGENIGASPGRQGRVHTRRSATEGQSPVSKKMKVDDEQEVSDLFQAKVVVDQGAVSGDLAKFVYRLAGEFSNSRGSGAVPITALWAQYYNSPEERKTNERTGRRWLTTRDELVRALEQLESDDLVMIDGDDVIVT